MKYRKKPVVIEAWQIPSRAQIADGEWPPMPPWLMTAVCDHVVSPLMDNTDAVTILTLEGRMRGQAGDWIIQGVKGELYPCKPDIFAATYELAEPASGEQS